MQITSVSNMTGVSPADLPSSSGVTAEQRTLIRAVGAVNASQAFGEDHELTYSIDRAARMLVIKLVNKTTGSVINQIPAEYLVRMAEKLNGG